MLAFRQHNLGLCGGPMPPNWALGPVWGLHPSCWAFVPVSGPLAPSKGGGQTDTHTQILFVCVWLPRSRPNAQIVRNITTNTPASTSLSTRGTVSWGSTSWVSMNMSKETSGLKWILLVSSLLRWAVRFTRVSEYATKIPHLYSTLNLNSEFWRYL